MQIFWEDADQGHLSVPKLASTLPLREVWVLWLSPEDLSLWLRWSERWSCPWAGTLSSVLCHFLLVTFFLSEALDAACLLLLYSGQHTCVRPCGVSFPWSSYEEDRTHTGSFLAVFSAFPSSLTSTPHPRSFFFFSVFIFFLLPITR